MNRRDAYLDGMLRHLGAAHYESLHGRASASDVARAVSFVDEHAGEAAAQRPAEATAPHAGDTADRRAGAGHHGRWHRRVRDVMTTAVVTVDLTTPYKQIAGLLAEHEVSALPVLTTGRRVAGVVSEADLLRMEDQRARRARAGRARGHPRWRSRSRPWGRTAAELMTSPAITIHPDATVAAAARLMNQHSVNRLPVVDPDGNLIGIASRRDLLSVFLRPDDEIADDVYAMLTKILFPSPADVKVTVRAGVVNLAGQLEHGDLVPVAVRLTWDIDGVVDVVNKLTVSQGS
jgi:CBS domain-containing protein